MAGTPTRFMDASMGYARFLVPHKVIRTTG
jgi:hypothetical protein